MSLLLKLKSFITSIEFQKSLSSVLLNKINSNCLVFNNLKLTIIATLLLIMKLTFLFKFIKTFKLKIHLTRFNICQRTIQKGPMAHRKWSQEQYKISGIKLNIYFSLPTSFIFYYWFTYNYITHLNIRTFGINLNNYFKNIFVYLMSNIICFQKLKCYYKVPLVLI